MKKLIAQVFVLTILTLVLIIVPIFQLPFIIFYSKVLLENLIFSSIFTSTILLCVGLVAYRISHIKNAEEKNKLKKKFKFLTAGKFLSLLFVLILVSSIFVNILLPLFVLASPSFTSMIETEGIVIDKREISYGRGVMGSAWPGKIREIVIETNTGRHERFAFDYNLEEWKKLSSGLEVKITHYPYIKDSMLHVNH